MASPLFWHISVERFAARWGAGRLRCLIEAGAPASVVRAAIACGQQAPLPDLIQSAVLYGDVRVLDVLCRALQARLLLLPHCRCPTVSVSFCRLCILHPFCCRPFLAAAQLPSSQLYKHYD
ncbi:hypothetical protein TW95_gp0604 [Pandoravirus inopinatum]|uniref:Uncharacterized protein n=1 Tax=Pandoravirus inopinatum TaxID=1605721 RepID=A0A0B5IX75_9VIRU|nr:hypothetical protein TW95_gp0604 [Pandoravirus inopinatum]AJF97338.1 hypothetical protein [Pandoravirus inopinatum]